MSYTRNDNIKLKLTQKERILFDHFEDYFSINIDNMFGITKDVALAKLEISKTVSERYKDSLMLSKTRIVIDNDYLRGLLSEIGDLFASNLDTMWNNRYIDEDDPDFEDEEPLQYYFQFLEDIDKYYNETLYIFFNRILPQPYAQKVKKSFMDISVAEFQRMYKDLIKDASGLKYLQRPTVDQEAFEYIIQMLEKDNLLPVIQYYNRNFDKKIRELKSIISQDDVIFIFEKEDEIKDKIDKVKDVYDKFHLKLIDMISEGLPIVRQSFENDVFYKEGTIITVRNAVIGESDKKEFIENIDIVFKNLERAKLDQVTYGLTIVYDTQSPYNSYVSTYRGAYFPVDEEQITGSDTKRGRKSKLDIEMLVANSVIIAPTGNNIHTIAHEIGHRFYYVFMSAGNVMKFQNSMTPVQVDMDTLYKVGKAIYNFFLLHFTMQEKEKLSSIISIKNGVELIDVGSYVFTRYIVKNKLFKKYNITSQNISNEKIKASIQILFRTEFIWGSGEYGRIYVLQFPKEKIIENTEQEKIVENIRTQNSYGYRNITERIPSSAYPEMYLMQGNVKTYWSEAFAELFAMYVNHPQALNDEQTKLMNMVLFNVKEQIEDKMKEVRKILGVDDELEDF